MKRLLITFVVFPIICFAQTASDYQLMKKDIKQAINSWLQKGEFEKSKDHESRIKNDLADAFQRICFDFVQMSIMEKGEAKFELLAYNADTEKFGVRFQLRNKIWQDSLPVPLNKAPQFKSNAPLSVTEIEGTDWVLVNDQLLPFRIKIKSPRGSFTWQQAKANVKEIEFISSDLGISALTGKNLKFSFSEYYLKAPLQITNDESPMVDNHTSNEKVFEKVEIEASVNQAQWRRHLENQLPRYVEAATSAGMSPGNYTVNVRFLIEKDGNIVDAKALNDPGYGLAEGAVEIVKRGPKWSQGEQNGRKISSYHTQPITFQIQEK
ncbi:MAG: hypothetical protein EOO46_17095 [Flavobacterium sp.]|nr:MAG: hypothetical protein EOO46_17095 [Flavobacterium sp.]